MNSILKNWNPLKELEILQMKFARKMEGAAASLFTSAQRAPSAGSVWAPTYDFAENPAGFLIRVELPDVEKIHLEFRDGRLVLSGERKFASHEKKEGAYALERGYGSFYRSFQLPSGVEENAISAKFADGVLKISLPKSSKEEKKQSRRIEIV